MQQHVNLLQQIHPSYTFTAGDTFRWNPIDKIIEYDQANDDRESILLLIHELGHAELGHTHFSSDLDLIRKEVSAWQYVANNAQSYNIFYDESVAERCLDSYRAWLDQRSSCPECRLTGYQPTADQYECINCKTQWSVSGDQQTRVCRRQINTLFSVA